MEERFGIAAFRSRQQVMAFEQALRKNGVRTMVVNTPRAVATGCGLSVRSDLADAEMVGEVWRAVRPGNLVGFYQVERDPQGRLQVSPMGMEAGYSG